MKYESSYIDCEISEKSDVYVREMNNIVEVVGVRKKSKSLTDIKRINKDEYLILSTGEINEYKKSENRSENIESLKETFKKLRWLINNNFKGGKDEVHLILTYAENMQDTKKLYKDFIIFWKRFKRKYGSDYDYILVPEPQERGSWHWHCLIKSINGKNIYIPSKDLSEVWDHGFIKIKWLEEVDNIGAYLSGYLCNAEASKDEKDLINKSGDSSRLIIADVDGETKAFIKGKRMKLYPPGMNIIRHSKGVKYPEKKQMKMEEVKKIVGACTPNYKKKVIIKNDNEEFINEIVYLNYNIRRQ